VLDKPKPSAAVAAQGKAGGKGGANAAVGAVTQQVLSKARVVRTETSAAALSNLVARWQAFKDEHRQVRCYICLNFKFLITVRACYKFAIH